MNKQTIDIAITVKIGDEVIDLTVPEASKNYLKFIPNNMRINFLQHAFHGREHKKILKAFEQALK